MKRIAVISAAYPPHQSPEADFAMHLCTRLGERGLAVEVLTSKGNVPRETAAGVTVHDIMSDWGWREGWRLFRWLGQVKPDAVLLDYIGWVFLKHQMITFAPLLAKLRMPRTRFVTLFHNAMGSEPGHTRTSRLLGRFLAALSGGEQEFGALSSWSDKVIVQSEHHLAVLEKRCHGVAKRSVLVPSPPILRLAEPRRGEEMRRRLGFGAKERLIGYFGYIYPGKGVETLIDAFDLLCQRRDDCRLLLIGRLVGGPHAGRPYDTSIKSLIAEKDCARRIILTGGYEADSDEGSAYLRALDACILPFDEGIQLNNSSFAAAAAHGLPVITTKHRALEAPFKDRQNVLLCPPKDAAAMAAAMIELMDDRVLAAKLAEGALDLARESFSWEFAIRQTVAALSGAPAN